MLKCLASSLEDASGFDWYLKGAAIEEQEEEQVHSLLSQVEEAWALISSCLGRLLLDAEMGTRHHIPHPCG